MPTNVKGVLVVPKYNYRNYSVGNVYEVIEVLDLGFGTPILIVYDDWGAKDMVTSLDPKFDIYYQI